MEIDTRSRNRYLDNVRNLVIALVVLVHTNITYAHVGGWYYFEGPKGSVDILSRALTGFINSFSQAWFMGILFFLGGLFASQSLKRKGTARFLKERMARLAVPLAAYMLIVSPVIHLALLPGGSSYVSDGWLRAWFGYVTGGHFLGATGPLWFAEVLLVFSTLYALFRALRPITQTNQESIGVPPSTIAFAAIILIIAIGAFSVRLFWPIGTSWMNLQFSFFSSYLVLFVLGVNAGERGWFDAMVDTRGLAWFGATLAIGIPAWLALMIFSGALEGKDYLLVGGLRPHSAAYALWESFVAVGMSLGIPAAFKKWADRPSRWREEMARNCFSIYFFHAPVLIALSVALGFWKAHPLVKIAVVWPTTIALTWVAAALIIRRIPFIRKYF